MGNVARFAALSTKLDAISGRFLQERIMKFCFIKKRLQR